MGHLRPTNAPSLSPPHPPPHFSLSLSLYLSFSRSHAAYRLIFLCAGCIRMLRSANPKIDLCYSFFRFLCLTPLRSACLSVSLLSVCLLSLPRSRSFFLPQFASFSISFQPPHSTFSSLSIFLSSSLSLLYTRRQYHYIS